MLVAWGTPGGAATARRLRAGGQVRATWVHPREGTALLPLGCGGPSSFWGGDKVGTKGSLSPGGGTGVLWGAGLLGAQGLCWPRGRGPNRDLSVERSPVNGCGCGCSSAPVLKAGGASPFPVHHVPSLKTDLGHSSVCSPEAAVSGPPSRW